MSSQMLAAAAGTKGDNQGKQILKQIEYLVKMYKLISHGENKKIKHECSSLTNFFIKNIATNFFIKNIAKYY